MKAFDCIGPVMVGPSSSHTAGAARAGNIARKLLGAEPSRAEITLYGSFAKTYYGHGTDKALIGGILGFEPDDLRIRDSFDHAKERGLSFSFQRGTMEGIHPNTVNVALWGAQQEQIQVTVSSIGGGAIQVTRIDGAQVLFNAQYHTTVVFNQDVAGVVADVTARLAKHKINIAFMRLFREEGQAIMVIETDQPVRGAALAEIRNIPHVNRAVTIAPFEVD